MNNNEMAAYLFVHFIGNEGSETDEQIYFSVSKNGTDWKTLNSKKPVLISGLGERGVRDPHIIRSPKGDKYYLIATDLSIFHRKGDPHMWDSCQMRGSRSIVVWESEDMTKWSDARLVEVAASDAGCAWAPEAVYDRKREQYMVFWASKAAFDNFTTQRIYRAFTADFKTFTKPEIYIDGGDISNIDTTIWEQDGVYYRFTKNESNSSVIMERSASLDDGFCEVKTYSINGVAGNAIQGYEGPTSYKVNGENKWCLLLDYFSRGEGYKPFITNDIAKGSFVSADDFNFDDKYRHGTVMPITQAEYDALVEKYGF